MNTGMETLKKLKAGAVKTTLLGIALFVCQCMVSNEVDCTCEEQSLDAWTTEFINRMNAGEDPEQADMHALQHAREVKSNCIQQVTLN
jgi:hypothetical protein